MKSNSLNFPFCAAVLLAANLAGVPILLAADPPPATPAPPTTPAPTPPGGTGGAGGTGGRTGGPGGFGGRGGGNFDRGDRSQFQGRTPNVGFGLDEKQRELLREATQKDSEEVRKLDEKLRSAQKELMHAVLSEKYDEKTVREKADAVSKLQVEITMLRSKALATVAPTLKPEQREQLESSPLGASLLGGGGFGFRGGPGGPGGFGGQGGGFGGPGGGDGGGYRGGRGGDGQPQPGSEQFSDGRRNRRPPQPQPQ